jgi:hypothetical protein
VQARFTLVELDGLVVERNSKKIWAGILMSSSSGLSTEESAVKMDTLLPSGLRQGG